MKKAILILALFGIVFFVSSFKSTDASYEEIEIEYNEVLVNYYRNPQVDKIPVVLDHILQSNFFRDKATGIFTLTAYYFGRIARLEPALIPKYMEFFEKMSQKHEGRFFILMVFQICGNETVKQFLVEKQNDKNFVNEKQDIQNILNGGAFPQFNPLTREIRDGADLDILWAEFFVTGNKEPILKIIDTLGWPDRFKSRLLDWSVKKHSNNEKRVLDRLLNQETRMNVDLDRMNIKDMTDLDCLFSAQLQFRQPDKKRRESIKKLRNILNITDEDILYMVVKGAALWSLQSNAQQHPKVLEYCKQEFEKRNNRSKVELAIILEIVSKGTVELIPTGEDDIVELELKKSKSSGGEIK